MEPFLPMDTLRMIYFSYTHSVLSYGIIFWGNSHAHLKNSIFKIQKSIITNSGSCDTWHHLFKQLWILSLPSQYILSLLVFVIKNRGFFQSNSEIHNLNTCFNHNLHLPSTNLTLVQKGVLHSGSKIYNHLPSNIKALSNYAKRFKHTLKNYLTEHFFYSLDEFYRSASWWLQFSFFMSPLLSCHLALLLSLLVLYIIKNIHKITLIIINKTYYLLASLFVVLHVFSPSIVLRQSTAHPLNKFCKI